MIGKKKLSEVRRELNELLEQLPKEPSGSWIEREIQTACPGWAPPYRPRDDGIDVLRVVDASSTCRSGTRAVD